MQLKLDRKIAGIALTFLWAVSLLNVVIRYATDVSIAFTEEFSIVLLVIVSLFGAAYCGYQHENISINALENRLSLKYKKILWVFQWVITTAVLLLMLWYGGNETYNEYSWDSRSAALGWPVWIYLIWLPIGSFCIIIRVTLSLIKRLRGEDVS